VRLARAPGGAPVPERRPHALERADGSVVDDPWHWLRERDDPAVIAQLEAENAHADTVLAPLAPLVEACYAGIVARVEESDASAPVLDGGWLYYHRTLAGRQRPIHCRRPAPDGVDDPRALPEDLRRPVDPLAPPPDEVVLIDEDAEAGRHPYFRLGGLAVSPDHRFAAELVDLDGSERFTVRVRDLASGAVIDEAVTGAGYGLAWHDDASAFLYTVPDAAWRPHEVRRHRVGTADADDEVLVSEPDERFWLGVGRTRSDRFLAVHSGSRTTDAWWLIEAADASAPARAVVAKADGVEVDLDHRGERLYLTTNADGARDFALVTVALDDPMGPRTTLVAHRPGVRLVGAEVFADLLVLVERTDARRQLRLCDPDSGQGEVLAVDEEASTTGLTGNPAFDRRVLRFAYTSLTTPTRVIDLDLDTGARTLVKEQPVRGGYDATRFTSWREWALAADGTRVPVSCVRRADVALDGSAPCLLYGYGAYESSIDPAFSAARLELLERGVVFAIAHVRGGGELGRAWYEGGRLAAKGNTFTDFIACADHLVERGIADRERLAVRGGSAGGLLIGAVLNLRPELAVAAVAEVPFVDVVTTMSDPTIPLTVIEWEEWGDPRTPADLAVMAAYSPYDNVRPAPYPACYVTAGLNDPRVGYWEPAKWVARLRERTTSDAPIVLRTELVAGHGGRSGRYEAWEDEARVQAFVLAALGAA
jgi:oligopeptidase B